MRKSKRRFRDRALAWFLTLIIVIGTVGGHTSFVEAAGADGNYTVQVVGPNDETVSSPVLNITGKTVTANEDGTYSCALTAGETVSYTASGKYHEENTGSFLVPDDLNEKIMVQAGAAFVETTFEIVGVDGKPVSYSSFNLMKDGTRVEPVNGLTYHLIPGSTYSFGVNVDSNSDYESMSGGYMAPTTAGTDIKVISLRSKPQNITFHVQGYGGSNLEGAIITIDGKTLTTASDGKVTFQAEKLKEYTYSVSCSGYDIKENLTVKGDVTAEQIVQMTLADIQLSKSEVNTKVGETFEISVENKAPGATYSWSSIPNIANIEPSQGDSVTVEVGKTSEAPTENATIIVEYGDKTATCVVTVSKKDAPVLTWDITPIYPSGVQANLDGNDAIGANVTVGGLDGMTGTVQFSYNNGSNDVNIGSPVTIENGVAAISLTEDNCKGLAELIQKGITVKAVYSGDAANNRTEATQRIQYCKTRNLEFTEEFLTSSSNGDYKWTKDGDTDVLNIDYGTYAKNGFSIGLKETSLVKDAAVTYQAESDIVSISEDGKISVNKLGESMITVTRAKNEAEGIAQSELKFKLVVTKKVNISDFTWAGAPVCAYSGKDASFEIEGTYKNAENISYAGELLKIKVKANVAANGVRADAKAGNYSQMILKDNNDATAVFDFVDSNEAQSYFKLDAESLKDTVVKYDLTIQKVKLDVKVNEAVTFEKNTKSSIESNIKSQTGKVVLTNEAVAKVVSDDTAELNKIVSEIPLKLSTQVTDEKLKVKTYVQGIMPDLEAANNKLENYELQCQQTNFANLIITKYNISGVTDIFDLIQVEGSGVWADSTNNLVWLKAYKDDENHGTLFVKPRQTNERTNEYDQVILNNVNVSDDGFTANGLSAAEITYPFYLKDSSDAATKTTDNNFKIKIDANAPIVTFDDTKTGTNLVDTLLSTISFGMYNNNKYVLPYEIAEDGAGYAGSSYYVMQLDNANMKEGAVTPEAIKAVAEGSDTAWSTCNQTGSIEVPESNAAAYIVLVKVWDNVGNAAVYASNGVVIETVRPGVDIEGLSEAIYAKDDAVKYKVKATDGSYKDADTKQALGVAGIDHIEMKIVVDGEIKEEHIYYADYETGKLVEQEPAAMLTVAPESKTYTTDELTLDSTYNSNNITIQAISYDRSGNVSEEIVKHVKVDRTEPQIQVIYDNNEPINEKYFDKTRTATVTVKERNFDVSKATFDLTLENGKIIKNGVTLTDLAEEGFVDVSEFEDSQKDITDDTQYTDERTLTAKITFKGDSEYKNFVPHCIDEAGNVNQPIVYDASTATGTEEDFIIDQTAPEIDVEYYLNGAEADFAGSSINTEAGRIYTNWNLKAKLVIKDDNLADTNGFLENQLTYTVDIKDYIVETADIESAGQKQLSMLKDFAAGGITGNEWKSQTIEYPVTLEGNYTVNYVYTDMAGHKVTLTNYFTVDQTPPTGEIEIKENIFKKFFNLITFHIFANETIEVTMRGDDTISSIENLEYCRLPELKAIDEITNWTKADAGKEASYSVDPNEEFVAYLKVTDKAGNTTYINSEASAIVDAIKPEIEVTLAEPVRTISRENENIPLYNTDVPFTITVKDPVEENGFSGISKVAYEVLKDGVVSQSNEYTYPDGVGELQEEVVIGDLKVESLKNNSNDVQIRVTVFDNAGNEFEKMQKLAIDTTNPSIAIEISPDAPANEKYFNSERTAKITVTERNFDESAFDFNLEYTGVNAPKFSEWTHSSDSGISDGATHTCTIIFSEGDDYKLNLICEDLAGMLSNTVEVKPFTVDLTDPEIKVSYADEGKNVHNNTYYDAYRTATIEITEHNFRESEVNAVITATLLGTSMTPPEISAWTTEGDKHRATINYNADADYKFDVAYTDLSGRTAIPKSDAFTVDTINPVISIAYTVDGEPFVPGQSDKDFVNPAIYSSKDIKAVITVNEINFVNGDSFAEQQIAYKATAKNLSGKEQMLTTDYQSQANNTATWFEKTVNSGIHETKEFVFDVSGNYATEFTYTDLAGRTATVKNYFTVDKTNPTGFVQIGGKNKFTGFNVFQKYEFFNNPVKMTVGGSDDISPIYPVMYYNSYESLSAAELAALPESAWVQGTEFTIGPNRQFITYFRVIDYSQRITYLSSESPVIVDDVKPYTEATGKPIITITVAEPTHGIYNSDVPFRISVEDPTEGDTYAGIEIVKYEIIKDGEITQTETFRYDKNKREKTIVMDKSVIASKNNSNDVKIKVTAVDNAGNDAVETKEIKIDTTKPTINIAFDNNSPLNGKYYGSTRTAAVTVTERNFSEADFRLEITNTDGTQPAISGWSHNFNSAVPDESTHTCTITFAADGDYTILANCTDLAGNAAQAYSVGEFTIDKTVPVISVSYDNNNARNGHYYNASRTATITITEHNFNASEVSVQTTAQGASAPGVSGWSTSGDRHTATVTFGSDADYTFDISYTDLAGNAAADYAQESFTVDLTNPEVEISGVANKSANKGTVAPVITLSDTNYDTQGITITLIGSERGRVDISNMLTTATMANGQTMTFLNFGEGMDDIYTLTAEAVDMAGNETSKSITFSVNRDGSTYKINESTKELLEKGYTNSPKDIVIQEINVDTLKFVELTYSKDGKVVKLTEGKDYTVEVSQTEGQWKIYTYTIKASCFEGEGDYVINIYSEDEAENATTNKAKQTTIEFVVDKTPPTIVISNLEDGGRYKEESHEFTLSVKDNTHLAYIEYYLDGQLVKTYEGEELTVEDGVIKISLDSAGSYQTVQIKAYDAAGNEIASDEYSVLVTSSAWIQFYMNKPLFYGVIAAIIIALALIIFLIGKRRKDDDEKKQA